MSETNLSICQSACTLAGLRPITSFVDTTDEAVMLAATYDQLKNEALAHHPWRFAMKEWALVASVDVPLNPRWTRSYELPAAVLRVTGVFVNGDPIEYDRMDNNIYADTNIDDTVIMEGIYSAGEAGWPPYFVTYVVLLVASMLALGVTAQPEIAAELTSRADKQRFVAKHADSAAQTTRRVRVGRLVGVRA